MEFYKRLVIKILERSSLGEENKLLKKMKSGAGWMNPLKSSE